MVPFGSVAELKMREIVEEERKESLFLVEELPESLYFEKKGVGESLGLPKIGGKVLGTFGKDLEYFRGF